MFTTHQQKDISGLLKQLWQADPFKGKWAILAKAYSLIRDREGKASAPLDGFLSRACPFIGIITPTDYFQTLGWQLSTNGGQLAVSQNAVPDITTFHPSIQTTNFCTDDIVAFCYQSGYGASTTLPNDTSIDDLTMATYQKSNNTSSDIDVPTGNVAATQNFNDSTVPTFDPARIFDPISATARFSYSAVVAFNRAAEEAAIGHIPPNKAALDRNTILFWEQNLQHPYNELFHPECELPFYWDPNDGDPGDAFDITSFDFETYWDNVDYSQNTPYPGPDHMED